MNFGSHRKMLVDAVFQSAFYESGVKRKYIVTKALVKVPTFIE